MKQYIEERALELGTFIIENRTTVRAAAQTFGISKSTVHKDVTERLKKLNPSMAKQVKRILEENKAERHIRGGEATRIKYKKDERKAG
ncbi:MAG: sporulation transcriptional regulator SpoIIID [Ruminiclostridium sp.]|nr:sporulation transcriptional regulator SpoIIID [Ruminiclostridium sp.]